MENIKEIASNILGLLLLLLLVVELIGYSTWNKRYFTFGIPIFMRTIPVNDITLLSASAKDMEAHCPSSFWGPSIQFREIGQGEYAFRDAIFRLFGLGSPPILRGYLAYDHDKKQISVKGYAILIFPIVIFGALSFFARSAEMALIVLGVFFGILYSLLVARFNAVANMAADLFTPKPAQKVNAG